MEKEKSVFELVNELGLNFTQLAAQEIALTKIEFTSWLSQMIKYTFIVAAGLLLAYAGLLYLLLALFLGSETSVAHLPGVDLRYWMPPFIIGAVVVSTSGLAIWLGANGLRKTQQISWPHQSPHKEKSQWIFNQVKT